MSVPKTSAGIKKHLERGFVHHPSTDFDSLLVYRPEPTGEDQWSLRLVFLTSAGAEVQIVARISAIRSTRPTVALFLPWGHQGARADRDVLTGTDWEHDSLVSLLFLRARKAWSIEPFASLLENPECEIGPFRFATEYRSIGTITREFKFDQRALHGLTVLRSIAKKRGSKRAALRALSLLFGLSMPESSRAVEDIFARRPEYFHLTGRAYTLSERGYHALHLLEERIGDDLPWPL